MQNGLERLLQGTARALVDSIAPAVSDPYAKAQALAAAEILANLATRVTWDPAYLFAGAESVEELARELPEQLRPDCGTVTCDDAASGARAAEAQAGEQLKTLSWLVRAAPPDADWAARVTAAVDADLDNELRRLRRRPEGLG